MNLSTPLTSPIGANLPAPFGPTSGERQADPDSFARELDQRLRDSNGDAGSVARGERTPGFGGSSATVGSAPAPDRAPSTGAGSDGDEVDGAAKQAPPGSESDAPARRPWGIGVGGNAAAHTGGAGSGKAPVLWPQGPRWPQPGGAKPAPGLPGPPETGPGLPGVSLDGRPGGTIELPDDPDMCHPTDPDCELPVSVLPDDSAPPPGSDPTRDRTRRAEADLGPDAGPVPQDLPADRAAALAADAKPLLPPPATANLPAPASPALPPPAVANLPAPVRGQGLGAERSAGSSAQTPSSARTRAGTGLDSPGEPGSATAGGLDGRFGARPTDPIRVPPGSPGTTGDPVAAGPKRGAAADQAKTARKVSGAEVADPRARAAQLPSRVDSPPNPMAELAPGREPRGLPAPDMGTGFATILGAAAGAGTPGAATFSTAASGLPGGTAAEARLAARPGEPGFGNELSTQISVFVRGGVQTARLMLNPAEMGPVQVQIQLDGKGAQVHLAAEHPATRQALEQAMPQLAATLRESGLTLTGGGVSEQARNFGGDATGNGNDQAGRRNAGSEAASRGAGSDDSLAGAAGASLRAASMRTRGVVDLVA
jgi:flagellar hook-length control protein FliK